MFKTMYITTISYNFKSYSNIIVTSLKVLKKNCTNLLVDSII